VAAKVILFIVAFAIAGAAASFGTVLLAILYFMAAGNAYSQAASAAYASLGSAWFTVPYLIAQNILFVLVAVMFVVFIDRGLSPLVELGLRPGAGALRQFLGGALISLVLAVASIAILLAAGAIRFEAAGPDKYGPAALAASLAVFLVATLFIGLGEEALFRGYLQRLLGGRYGVVAGLIATSIIFALAHTVTYDRPLPIMGVFMASAVMGYLFVITGSLWASIGLHAAWDFLFLQVFELGKPTIELGSYPLLLFSSPRQVAAGGVSLGGWDDLVATALLALTLVALYIYDRRRRAGRKNWRRPAER
jgi:hypothetical protein